MTDINNITLDIQNFATQKFGSGATASGLQSVVRESTLAQPDGKTIVVTTGLFIASTDSDGRFTSKIGQINRFNSDGSLDLSFGDNGKIFAVLGKSRFGAQGFITNGVIYQSDGKILVSEVDPNTSLSTAPATPRIKTIKRYNTNGIIETSFGTNGSISTDVFPTFVKESGGKIFVVGSALATYQPAIGNAIQPVKDTYTITKYNSNGTLDTIFGNEGRIIFSESRNGEGRIRHEIDDIIQQPNGQMVVRWSYLSDNNIRRSRFNADGTVDPSFLSIPNVTATIGTALSFAIPATAFSGPEPAFENFTYIADLTNSNGSTSALPSWLAFNSNTRTFSGTPPAGTAAGSITVRVFAIDADLRGGDSSAVDYFTIIIGNTPPAPTSIQKISTGISNAQANGSSGGFDVDDFAISRGGARVVFTSEASNLVANDPNGGGLSGKDVFLYTRATNSTRRIAAGATVDISDNGRYIVYDDKRLDLDTNTTITFARGADGQPLTGPNGALSSNARISGDGRYIVFSSYAKNLVDNNSSSRNEASDIFLFDAVNNTTIRITNSVGSVGNAIMPEISDDGSLIAYVGEGGGALLYNRLTRVITNIGLPSAYDNVRIMRRPIISADNRYIYTDGYRYDTTTNTNTRYTDPVPVQSSDGGHEIIKANDNVNLVSGDNNGFRDLFIRSVAAAPANRAPVVATPISDTTATIGTALNYVIPANAFSDPDAGNTLTYTAAKADGTALPSWLTFNTSTRTFSGTPPTGTATGPLALRVTARDNGGLTVSDNFNLTLNSPAPVNRSPVVATPIADTTATIGTALSYVIPATAFSDPDAGNTITYTAAKADGTALPSWLTFNASTRTFSGTPPTGTATGPLAVRVTARDNGGLTVSDNFNITVGSGTTPPLTGIRKISNGINGAQGNDRSGAFGEIAISRDGLRVVFGSLASNLVTTDPNGGGFSGRDVFLYNRDTNTVTRIAEGFTPDISDNGRYITYNDKRLDLDTNTTITFARGLNGAAPTGPFGAVSNNARISRDGRYIAFYSHANNLVAGDTNNNSDIFLFDTVNSTTIKVSSGAGFSNTPEISDDGSLVAYTQNGNSVYLYNRLTGTNTKISPDNYPTGDIDRPIISADNRYVYYEGYRYDTTTSTSAVHTTPVPVLSSDGGYEVITADDGQNLVSGDTNGFSDVFLRPVGNTSANRPPTVATPIADTTATIGTALNYVIPATAFSDPDAGNTLTYSATKADGTALPSWLTFNASTRTFSGTPPTGTATGPLSLRVTATDGGGLSVSDQFNLTVGSGTTVPPLTGTRKITLTPTKGQTNNDSESTYVTISNDGRYVLYASKASNLVAGDTNNRGDLFLYDRITDTNTKIGDGVPTDSASTGGLFPTNGSQVNATISSNGRYVVYQTSSGLSVYDTTSKISTAAGTNRSSYATISNDGNLIAFQSDASNIVSGDSNGRKDVFLFNRTANTTIKLPNTFGSADFPVLAPDGSFVVYSIIDETSILSPNANNGLYLYNVATGTSTRLPDSNVGIIGLGLGYPHISADGRFVTYRGGANGSETKKFDRTTSTVSAGNAELVNFGSAGLLSGDGNYRVILAPDSINLVPGDNNGFKDLFITAVNGGGGNQAPTVSAPIANQLAVSGTPFSFVIPTSAFSDPEGSALTYEITLGDGSALPSWLTFNATTRTFSGTPPTGDPVVDLKVTAKDSGNLSVSDTFRIGPASALGGIPGVTVAGNLFRTGSSLNGFAVNPVSQAPSQKVSEIALFAIDDLAGKIGTLNPTDPGYLAAAVAIARPIFSTLADPFFSTDRREISLDPNKIYQVVEIVDGSLAQVRQQIAAGQVPTNLLFSNPTGTSPIRVVENDDGYRININNNELVLDVTKLTGTTAAIPIGAKSQGLAEGRLIDLSDYANQTLNISITNTSSAYYGNQVGFYEVKDLAGTITVNGRDLRPGDVGYAEGAVRNAVLQTDKSGSQSNQAIVGGKIYAPVAIANGTFATFLANNSANTNNAAINDNNETFAYFNYVGANPDRVDHFRLLTNNTFGVEDVYGGGDRDFNDIRMSMTVNT
jgi:Tol biopolymer transport system component